MIVVHPDGSLNKYSRTGKPNPKTSATAEKLASGHGGWTRVSGAGEGGVAPNRAARAVVPAPTLPEVEARSRAVPAGSRARKPMDFNEAPVEDIPKYAADERYHFQQKVDGIRAQLVIEPGRAPWFRSKSGERLASPTAEAVTRPLLARLGAMPSDGPGYVVDGEVVNGKWHVFDMVADGGERMPFEERSAHAAAWVKTLNDAGIHNVSALPVAKTKEQKLALAHAIRDSGGEGVMLKRADSPYDFGSRVNHTLKAKYVSSADVVISKLRPDGKESAEISVYDNGRLKRVGTVPLGGKESKLGTIHEGDVVEVNYLYAMPDSHNLVQARLMKKRPDKDAKEATTAQLRKVDKRVIDLPAASDKAVTPSQAPVPAAASARAAMVDAVPKASITPAEVHEALDDYSSTVYKAINPWLRGDAPLPSMAAWVKNEKNTAALARKIAAIDTAMRPSPRERTLYRRTHLPPGFDPSPGATYVDPAFQSTSPRRGGETDDAFGDWQFVIHAPAGTPMADVPQSGVPEVLLARSTQLRVRSADPVSKRVVVDAVPGIDNGTGGDLRARLDAKRRERN